MSLDNEDDQFMESMRPASTTQTLTAAEKELQQLQQSKQEQLLQQNKRYLEDLFHENRNQPIRVKNVQITNSQSYRDAFLHAQFAPLLNTPVVSLQTYLACIGDISKSLIKSGVVENLLVSTNLVNPPMFSRDLGASLHVVPVFNVIPVKRFFAKTGTNIGNGEGDGYIQFQLRNLFGGGENLIFDAITGTKTLSSYLVNYNLPVFSNLNYISENIVSLNTRKLDWIQSDVTSRGMVNKVYTQFNNSKLNHEVVLENTWKVLNNRASKSMEVIQQSGSQYKSSIAYNMIYDTRDNKHLPRMGKLLQLGVEYNGLFKFNKYPYLKTAAQTQFVQQLPWINSRVILTNKMGVLFPLGEKSSLLDRFYIGGPNDVRSFVLNGLGPKDYNSCIGGDLFLNGGVSLVSDIPKYKESNFKIHNFVNFGKLMPMDKSIGLAGNIKNLTNEFSVSYGIGILFNHPMARFELNFVLPLVTQEKDILRKGIQYGIGVSFL
ncbi:Sorting assembly machinery subunit [Candida viswanathii]|uniref:Sorting assembly machinery subunit n=1 Tax=Candida viswanathii TaxID=5486 RepID=A0A367XWZ5_9ASCO|nr:Sorting assembly machinery subunit [Candida viswanathii]